MKSSNMQNNRSMIFFFTMQTMIAVMFIVYSASPSFADTTQYARIQANWSIAPAMSDTFHRTYDHVSPYMTYSYDHIAGGPYESSSPYVPYPGSGSYGDKITTTNSSGVTSSNGVSTFTVNRAGVGDFRSGSVTLEATTTAIVPTSGSIYEEFTYDASVINIFVPYALYGMTAGGLYDPNQPAPYWDLTVNYDTFSSLTHTGSASYWPRTPRFEIFGKYRIWEEDETTGSLIGQEWYSSYLFGAPLTSSPLVFPLNPFDPDFQSVIDYWGESNPMIANPERGILELVVLVSSEADEYRQNQDPGAVPEPSSLLLLGLGLMGLVGIRKKM